MVHGAFVGLYLIILIGVGAMKSRSIATQEDFSLAGRGLSTTVLVGTLLATWIGTGSIFGNAEQAYRVGLPALILPVSGALGILMLFFLAPRARASGAFTIQDILEERFGLGCRIMGSVALVLAYVIIVSYQYRAGATVIGYLSPDLSETLCTVVVAIFVILYTALAGMYSVAYTDVANGVLMTVGIVIALPILVSKAGGTAAILETLGPAKNQLFGHYSPAALISVTLPAFLLLLGDANMYQRFFAAHHADSARKAAGWMLVGVVFLECAIIGSALAAAALVSQGQLEAPQRAGHIIVHAGFHALPTALGALLVATVVAVVVSTADSYLLAPATSLVRDIYQRLIDPEAAEARLVRVSRLCVVGLGLLALALAFMSDEFFAVSLFAYTIYGAVVTPAILAALFWPRARPGGVLAGMIAGMATAIAWKAFGGQVDLIRESKIDAVLPATFANMGIILASSSTRKPLPD